VGLEPRRGAGRLAGALIEWLSGRAERAAIEADVREEFAFHVAKIEEELRAQGVEGTAAREQVQERFGDTERLVQSASRIKTGGTVMLQKVNLVLLVVVVACAVWMALQMRQSQLHSMAAIEAVSARLEDMNKARGGARAEEQGIVYVTGDVQRRGPYQMPLSGLSVRRAVLSAGVNAGPAAVSVIRRQSDGKVKTLGLSAEEFANPAGADIDLMANDQVIVGPTPTPPVTPGMGDGVGLKSGAASGASGPVAYVQGGVKDPGSYYLGNGMTLRKLLAVAGLSEWAHDVAIRRTDSTGKPIAISISQMDLANPTGTDPVLEPEDIVTVY